MKKLRWIALSAICLAWAASGFATCRVVRIAEIPVTVDQNRAFIDAQINGQDIKAMVDTGAAMSFLWQNEAQRLGLPIREVVDVHRYGVGGEAKAFAATAKHFQMGSFVGDQIDFNVVGTMTDARRAPLVLGYDFLSHFTTEFDLARGVIRLFRPEDCQPAQVLYWSNTYSLADLESFAAWDPKIKLNVIVNDKRVIAILDSGAGLSDIDQRTAERIGVIKAPTDSISTLTGVAGRPITTYLGYFATLAVGDEVLHNAKFQVAELFSADRVESAGSRIAYTPENIPQMLLGCDFFLSHRILVFPKERKLLFTYNGGPVLQAVRSVPAWNPDAQQGEGASAAVATH
jgi:clan AA aspartic protease (TIGR02281 family)